MEELRKAAFGHYQNSSAHLKGLAWKFFQTMDTNGDGRVSRAEFENFLRQSSHGGIQNNTFAMIDRNGDDSLDFWEVLTLYYIFKTRNVVCRSCRTSITALYFTCVNCFVHGHESSATYDLCLDCYGKKRYSHPHSCFLDSYAILRYKRRACAPSSSWQSNPHHIDPPLGGPNPMMTPQSNPHHIDPPLGGSNPMMTPQSNPHHIDPPLGGSNPMMTPQSNPHHIGPPLGGPNPMMMPQSNPHHIGPPFGGPNPMMMPQSNPHHIGPPFGGPNPMMMPQSNPYHQPPAGGPSRNRWWDAYHALNGAITLGGLFGGIGPDGGLFGGIGPDGGSFDAVSEACTTM